MNAFVTHPSVRIKGTENNYDPVQCLDVSCPNKAPHMHCPFCVKLESFQDPVILRAHYRVKHVDKGIEFAGLIVLRCCDHCDIVGTIKGVKEFKGAHWHCYKCKNGFNRRDEAVKHYRTHFRNPHTTFQIQISQLPIQDVVQHYQQTLNAESATNAMELAQTEEMGTSIPPVLNEAVVVSSSGEAILTTNAVTYKSLSNGKPEDGSHVSVAANETVGPTEGQTIMIIQEEPFDGSHLPAELTNPNTLELVPATEAAAVDQQTAMEQQVVQLLSQVRQLEAEKAAMESEHQQEINKLKEKVSQLEQELQESSARESDLLSRLAVPLDITVENLLEQMKTSHQELLHQQLASLKRTYQQQALGGIKLEPIIVMKSSTVTTPSHSSTPITIVTAEVTDIDSSLDHSQDTSVYIQEKAVPTQEMLLDDHMDSSSQQSFSTRIITTLDENDHSSQGERTLTVVTENAKHGESSPPALSVSEDLVVQPNDLTSTEQVLNDGTLEGSPMVKRRKISGSSDFS